MSAAPSKYPRPGRPKDDYLAARRRAEIVVHAIPEFAKNGYTSADLDRIAANAGCSKGTLYNYFENKGALFAASVDHVMFSLVQRVTGGSGTEQADADDVDPLDRIEDLVRAFLQHFAEHPQYVELLVQERSDFRDRAEPTFNTYRVKSKQIWYDRFAKLAAQGRMHAIAPEQAFTVLVDLLYGTIFMNYFRQRVSDPTRQADEILQVLLGGLLTDDAFAAQQARRQSLNV